MFRSGTQSLRRLTLGVSAVLVFVGMYAPNSRAQGATGRIVGTVLDARGAAIVGASVAVTSTDTALARETTTNREGRYAAEFLAPGRYVVRVDAVGFATVVISDAVVRIAETTSLSSELSPSLGAETITVSSDAPLLQTESSHLGRVVEQEQLRGLPLPTRNFQQLLSLSPGTSAALFNTTDLGRGDAAVSVNGQRTTSNNVRMNGVDANAVGGNATANLAVPSVDAIREFVIQTSLYDASSGRGVGGNVEVVTLSGSNRFHGGVYEYVRDDALNANDFFLNTAGRPRPVLVRNQFGALLGGPIVSDTAYFFVSYQGTRERNGASAANSLASPTIPVGLRDDNRSAAGLAAAFGVPEETISSVSVALLNARLPGGEYAVPSPTTPSGLTPLSTISRFRENQYNANVDLFPADGHALAGKWFSADNATSQAISTFGGLANGPTQLPGFGADAVLTNRLLSVTDTWTLGPSAVNSARFGWSLNELVSTPVEPFTAEQFGISSPLASLYPGMPTIAVVGLFTLGSSVFADSGSRSTASTFADTLSILKGAHHLRLGGEYRHNRARADFRGYTRGQVVFSSFEAFLTGQTTSVIGSGVFDRSFRLEDFAWFVQDDYRVSDRLTLNLGIRYDSYGLPVESEGRFVNFLPEAFAPGVSGEPALPPNGLVQAGNASNPLPGVPFVQDGLVDGDRNNFGPRLGFAWSPTSSDHLVVRGGYGVYYDRMSARWALFQAQAFPYYSLASAAGRPFEDPFVSVPLPSEFPVLPTIPSPLGTPVNGNFVDPNLRTPIVQQFGTNVQWEPAHGLLFEVGYVGARGSKLFQYVSLNQPVYDRQTGSFVAPFGSSLSTQKVPTTGAIQVQTSGRSRYDSLQASATKQFAHGLQILSSYTLGRSVDTYSGAPANDLVAIAGDQSNPLANEGRSDFDRRHRFVSSFVYDIPALGGPALVRAVLGEWRVGGIVTLQSGLPFSVVDIPNNFVVQRANGSSDGALDGDVHDRLGRFFDTSAYVPSRPFLSPGVLNPDFDPASPFGSAERNRLSGPAARNVDLSVTKVVELTEQLRLELRSEFFNLFNWVNFANPNANIAVAPTFGRITTTAGGPRVIQFSVKLDF